MTRLNSLKLLEVIEKDGRCETFSCTNCPLREKDHQENIIKELEAFECNITGHFIRVQAAREKIREML